MTTCLAIVNTMMCFCVLGFIIGLIMKLGEDYKHNDRGCAFMFISGLLMFMVGVGGYGAICCETDCNVYEVYKRPKAIERVEQYTVCVMGNVIINSNDAMIYKAPDTNVYVKITSCTDAYGSYKPARYKLAAKEDGKYYDDK